MTERKSEAQKLLELMKEKGIDSKNDHTNEASWKMRQSSRIACFILVALFIILIAAFSYLYSETPTVNEVKKLLLEHSGSTKPEAIIKTYKELSNLAFERFMKICQYVISTAGIPLVTFLFGHAFGSELKTSKE